MAAVVAATLNMRLELGSRIGDDGGLAVRVIIAGVETARQPLGGHAFFRSIRGCRMAAIAACIACCILARWSGVRRLQLLLGQYWHVTADLRLRTYFPHRPIFTLR